MAFSTFVAALAVAPVAFAADAPQASWNPKAAAAYLDQRMEWWAGWNRAQRDHGTFCISCHTALTFAMARPALRLALHEPAPAAAEQKLLDNVTKRASQWADVEPFYNDKASGPHKTEQSRGSESIFNALILANRDAANPLAPQDAKLNDDVREAFRNMWALQLKSGPDKGAWSWINFNNRPWEADDSQYYGTALAAVALGMTPRAYRDSDEIRDNVAALRDYLAREYDHQSLVNRVAALWATTGIPDVVTPAQKLDLLKELEGAQNPDGGWSLSSIAGAWDRHDKTPQETKSDGYATGLIVYVLERSMPDFDDPHMGRALNWLKSNQNKVDGSWPAYSLNKNRDLTTDIGRFMSDAATAYAALALNFRDVIRRQPRVDWAAK